MIERSGPGHGRERGGREGRREGEKKKEKEKRKKWYICICLERNKRRGRFAGYP